MFQFKIFQQFRGSLRHAVLPRETEFENFRMDGRAPVFFKTQLHGTKIVIPANRHFSAYSIMRQSRNLYAGIYSRFFSHGDALATSETNIPLLIRIADCASILLFDPENKVISNIHAGWRGLAKKIIHKTVARLEKKFATRSEKLIAAISPMIGPCCCRFSEPLRELPRHMHKYIRSLNVDLWAATETALLESGISLKNIENPRICTFCSPQKFPSFRRDKNSARFATVIMLT